MKMDQDHYVPLTDPALAVLDEMRNGSQGELIFVSPDARVATKTISEVMSPLEHIAIKLKEARPPG
ncbi:hypothetical protein IVA77_13365 [Bradyrhizobium sp. 136]|nr:MULTISPECIES: hypothetical protein [unclassified Bradyrhizobium]MCK1294977.1 hypothetical protein [Bradyrhizobium sp. 30]MCK1309400.1 hypothetical protein [Bradyrhizobium sp. 45]MCK1312365.1 hypothetical protein [Bradyrhizobium sp. 23]MCK1506899.1 hypothetical protein [Bradyrhizobium sp. 18]MCK1574585.1 hypothetical protein [Bradyrhizobium sp. 174]